MALETMVETLLTLVTAIRKMEPAAVVLVVLAMLVVLGVQTEYPPEKAAKVFILGSGQLLHPLELLGFMLVAVVVETEALVVPVMAALAVVVLVVLTALVLLALMEQVAVVVALRARLTVEMAETELLL